MTIRRYKAALKDFFYQYGRGTGKGSTSDQQIRFMIQFDGRIDLDRLERTLHAITYIDPILGCRFVETGVLKGYWERREDLDAVRLCQVIATDDPKAAVSSFINDLNRPNDAPLFEVLLARTDVNDTLCLRVDHQLADGGGTKAIAHLIADTYRQLTENPGLQFGPGLGRFRKRTVMGLTNYHGPIQAPEQDEHNFHPSPFFIPKTGTRNEDAVYALRVIEPEDFLCLKSFGKERGATVNDLILTALTRALQPFVKDPETAGAIQISSDYRSRLPKEVPEPICNLFGAHFPVLHCVPGESFATTLKRVNNAMQAIRDSFSLEQAIEDERFFMGFIREWANELGWPPFREGEIPTHIILSNFKTQDESHLDFGIPVKDALQLGTVSLGKEFMLCASTYKNRLTISHGYCRSDIDPKIVEGIMDRINAALRV